jgi:hypothetical protein
VDSSISATSQGQISQEAAERWKAGRTNCSEAKVDEDRNVRGCEEDVGGLDVVMGDKIVVEKSGGGEEAPEVRFGLLLERWQEKGERQRWAFSLIWLKIIWKSVAEMKKLTSEIPTGISRSRKGITTRASVHQTKDVSMKPIVVKDGAGIAGHSQLGVIKKDSKVTMLGWGVVPGRASAGSGKERRTFISFQLPSCPRPGQLMHSDET